MKILCEDCVHSLVCRFSKGYEKIQKQIDDLEISDVSGFQIRLSKILWLEPTILRCHHFIEDKR